MITQDKIKTATHTAIEEFWDLIAKSFPEIKTGDLDIDSKFAFDESALKVVKNWLKWNGYSDTEELDQRFKPCGLNADWWCRTWHVKDDIYICDNEDMDETFTVGKRIELDEDEVEDEALFTGSIEQVINFIENMK